MGKIKKHTKKREVRALLEECAMFEDIIVDKEIEIEELKDIRYQLQTIVVYLEKKLKQKG